MRRRSLLAAPFLLLLAGTGCAAPGGEQAPAPSAGTPPGAAPPGVQVATFAGGCFWCLESDLDKLDGVMKTTSGYTGGTVDSPTYEQVSDGATGHLESVQVEFDPLRLSYERLLDAFWHAVDPTDPGGQFCDRGAQYRTAIFVHDAEQRKAAEASKAAMSSVKPFAAPLVTEILQASTFWPAEEYHQDYASKNPIRYRLYRTGCGRDRRLEDLWGESAARH